MALVGDSIHIGLNVIRLRLGDNAYRFILNLGQKKQIDTIAAKNLCAIGSLCGLNQQEVEAASGGPIWNTKFPLWLRLLLLIVAFFAASQIIWIVATGRPYGLYIPGTLYASLHPNDFSN